MFNFESISHETVLKLYILASGNENATWNAMGQIVDGEKPENVLFAIEPNEPFEYVARRLIRLGKERGRVQRRPIYTYVDLADLNSRLDWLFDRIESFDYYEFPTSKGSIRFAEKDAANAIDYVAALAYNKGIDEGKAEIGRVLKDLLNLAE